jgi:uncharacterized protein YifN (PemK superfamily)
LGVISYKNKLTGPCLVVPILTVLQDDNPWAHRLAEPIGDVPEWAICNQPSTVLSSRFNQFAGKIPVLPKADFNQVLEKLMQWLPKPFPVDH